MVTVLFQSDAEPWHSIAMLIAQCAKDNDRLLTFTTVLFLDAFHNETLLDGVLQPKKPASTMHSCAGVRASNEIILQ